MGLLLFFFLVFALFGIGWISDILRHRHPLGPEEVQELARRRQWERLLTAYAFWELGQIARISAGVVLIAALLLLLLSFAGWLHLRRTPEEATI